jgi:NADH-quinone oxidoreductase subunit C
MHHEIHPSASPAAIELHNHIKDALLQSFDNDITGSQIDYDFPVFTVAKNRIHDVLEFLKNSEGMGFKFLTTLCGVHYPENKGSEFALVYQLHNMEKNHRVRIKIFMATADLIVPTATDLWLGANWMEREAFDFYGFRFQGHPDLRRILNMDEMNYHPLRKEYALEDAGRDDKEDKYFGR